MGNQVMGHPLWAHRLKLRRAYEHLHELEKEINVFVAEERDKLRASFEERPDGWWYILGTGAIVPTPYWGVIVGDFAHNLRSLLDQLVWSLVIANKEKPRGNSFPMCNSLAAWESTVLHPKNGPSPLEGVRLEAIAEIQWLQPYHPGNEPLDRLSWLSNTDKHRLVHPASVMSADSTPIGSIKQPDGTMEELTEVQFKRDVSLGEGAEAVVEVKLPGDFTLERAVYVGIDRFPVEIAFGKRALRFRDFKEIYDFVSRVLDRFDSLI